MILYAALVGLLFASYISPLQGIIESKNRIAELETEISTLEEENVAKTRLTEELETTEGVERAARERYGMMKPGEKVYLVTEE